MKLIRLACKPELAVPMLALLFATAACLGLVGARIAWTGDVSYCFLVWNLFLAWLPLVFALLAWDEYAAASPRRHRLGLLAGAWLLFFPNAPYIFTDIIHLYSSFHRHFWVDLALILSCAVTGLVLGFVSLYLMQSIVMRLLGRVAGWVFIAVVAGLSGFGIYLGRFLRFNSWDVIWKPFALGKGIFHWAASPLAQPGNYAFPALFAAFLFISYLMLYALTHLRVNSDRI